MEENSIIDKFLAFIIELSHSLKHGYLFFGSSADLLRYLLDIIIVAALFYWILLFVRQSRAWQLMKGILLIFLFVIISGFLGLSMVGFLFDKFLYMFAILFIVLFQPELRRALETVGLKSFGSIKNLFNADEVEDKDQSANMIHEISLACRDMARSYTGALILIERHTRLDELLQQENVVKFDSMVTNSVLQSIFYKGAPMHDGALLIREGRIVAARCHVPLSVTMHSLDKTGTRHRAAVGASEMGDTVVVVVSEERGKISIAVNGRLYEMKNSQELEANLLYLLGLTEKIEEKKGLSKFIGKLVSYTSGPKVPEGVVDAATEEPKTKKAGEEAIETELKPTFEKGNSAQRAGFTSKVLLMALSLLISLGLWIYIQIDTNPVVSTKITVPIKYTEEAAPDNMQVSYPIDTVDIEIVGRKSTIDSLTVDEVLAYIDYSSISNTGVVELPVVVTSADNGVYFRVERQIPETISVTVYSTDSSDK